VRAATSTSGGAVDRCGSRRDRGAGGPQSPSSFTRRPTSGGRTGGAHAHWQSADPPRRRRRCGPCSLSLRRDRCRPSPQCRGPIDSRETAPAVTGTTTRRRSDLRTTRCTVPYSSRDDLHFVASCQALGPTPAVSEVGALITWPSSRTNRSARPPLRSCSCRSSAGAVSASRAGSEGRHHCGQLATIREALGPAPAAAAQASIGAQSALSRPGGDDQGRSGPGSAWQQ
jgi:hypothetical protein